MAGNESDRDGTSQPTMAADTDPVPSPERTVVLVGLMGAGKSTVGRRLASRLELPFVDADTEIERAAGCTIPEIFERFGEPYFRDGEQRVLSRLLTGGTIVLAAGGGAFMNAEIRRMIRANGISVWLHASLDVLAERCGRRTNRPLLTGRDGRSRLASLMAERYPTYAEADLRVESGEGPHDAVVEQIIDRLDPFRRGRFSACTFGKAAP